VVDQALDGEEGASDDETSAETCRKPGHHECRRDRFTNADVLVT
jgi:hypothetical protein